MKQRRGESKALEGTINLLLRNKGACTTMNEEYKKYLLSPEWKRLKASLILARGEKCERCKEEMSKRRLQVHHLTYVRIFKELPEDLLLVCRNCHLTIHGLNIKGEKIAPKVKKPRPVNPKHAMFEIYNPGFYVRRILERNERGVYKTAKQFNNALKSARRRDYKHGGNKKGKRRKSHQDRIAKEDLIYEMIQLPNGDFKRVKRRN